MGNAELLGLLEKDQKMMEILTIINDLNLADTWLCAGTIRNYLWNILSGKEGFDESTDVDVVFFDPAISYEETVSIEAKLKKAHPQYQWELKNQVYMHIHNPKTPPYQNSRNAIASFPEQCTAIGLRLEPSTHQLELFAPYGIQDIVAFIVRPTPYFLADSERMEMYHQRMEKKNWQEKWPELRIL